MRVHRYVPTAVGLLALAALAGLAAWFIAGVYGSGDALWAFGIGYPVLVISSLIAWQSEKWPEDWQDLLRNGLISIVVGAGSFAVDAAISTSNYPKLPFREAIWHAGSPFGIVLTIAI